METAEKTPTAVRIIALLPIREAYEWKLAKQDDGVNYAILASNS
ncbi:hypothetical protein MAESPC_00733 [Microcystis aeruginosa SPC777]|uniref:Uncharacterized protein n=1 Tax=Microcystis aeruginosa SPC777 TaxID=482300 RepID=S3JGI4_MICAE|nr:hypothetical protein MAESPC_00733 [Microcystis aeruginosa SPC777]